VREGDEGILRSQASIDIIADQMYRVDAKLNQGFSRELVARVLMESEKLRDKYGIYEKVEVKLSEEEVKRLKEQAKEGEKVEEVRFESVQ